jgi:hypothetical protein
LISVTVLFSMLILHPLLRGSPSGKPVFLTQFLTKYDFQFARFSLFGLLESVCSKHLITPYPAGPSQIFLPVLLLVGVGPDPPACTTGSGRLHDRQRGNNILCYLISK